ncbi:ABC-type transport auxiliary lipoprotein family protein [Burkholderia sp. NLJ2]|uniref:ABC-type transport auxiliary lipoprotein family protein n=1 Tax=Burkholderia sp. NLJ2 TaxID=3090699 RepID=UPI003C6C62C6
MHSRTIWSVIRNCSYLAIKEVSIDIACIAHFRLRGRLRRAGGARRVHFPVHGVLHARDQRQRGQHLRRQMRRRMINMLVVHVQAPVAGSRLVMQTSPTRDARLEDDRWASPVGDEIRRALSIPVTHLVERGRRAWCPAR